MAGSASTGSLYGTVSANWTPDATVAVVGFSQGSLITTHSTLTERVYPGLAHGIGDQGNR
jgi:predicted esterase